MQNENIQPGMRRLGAAVDDFELVAEDLRRRMLKAVDVPGLDDEGRETAERLINEATDEAILLFKERLLAKLH